MTSTGAPLAIERFSAGYGNGELVVRNATFTLRAGAMTALVGPNGAGKSTLLKGALGLLPQVDTSGVRYFGQPLDDVRARVAYLPQRADIDWTFPASALDVAAMGLYRKIGFFHRVSGRWKAEARRALALVDMENFADMPIGELSGGQQQRVLLARSLAQGADLLMHDEPFVNVDFATAERLGAILRLACARGMTVFAVHHDLGDVRRFFDEAVLFDGTVVAHGPIEVALADAKLHEAFRLGPPPQEQLA